MSRQPLEHFTVRLSAGDLVYADGDQASTMFVVQSGEVRLYRESGGTETELAVMGKGDFFGEMSILEGIPRSGFARAVVDSELLEINSVTFDKMIKGNIEIAVRLLRKLSRRLREAEKRAAELQRSVGTAGSPVPVAVGAAVAEAAEATRAPDATDAIAAIGALASDDAAGAASPVADESADPAAAQADAEAQAAAYAKAEAEAKADAEAEAAAQAEVDLGPRLEVPDGPTYSILIDDCVIGRFDPVTDESPDVDLTEVDLKRSVSRRHARIRIEGESFELVEEIGALNGTFVNGEKLSTGEPQTLSDGDRVSVGTVQMLFRC